MIDTTARSLAETTRTLERMWRRRDRRSQGLFGELRGMLYQIYDENAGGVPVSALPQLAGDVTGAITANTIARLRGTPVSGIAPQQGQALVFDGTQWLPGAPGDATGTIIDYSSLVNEATVPRGASASASSTLAGYSVQYPMDQDDWTFWLTAGVAYPGDPAAGAWWKVDLGSAKEITWYRVVQPLQQAAYRATSSKLQSSTDNVTWTDRVTFGIFGDSGLNELPTPITARYWRMLGVSMTTLLSLAENDWGLASVYLYSGQPTIQAPGHIVEDEGVPLLQRNTLNFVGDDVAAADSGGKTVVTVTGAIRKALVDQKGDLIVGTADNTPARLAVGADGYVLTADAAQASGVKWAAAAAPASRWEVLVDGTIDGFIWAGTPGNYSLVYVEVP